jgi:hypothetical protein
LRFEVTDRLGGGARDAADVVGAGLDGQGVGGDADRDQLAGVDAAGTSLVTSGIKDLFVPGKILAIDG